MGNARLHALLILSDSALPLGSFAFSSGLESYIAHRKTGDKSKSTVDLYPFLLDSVTNVASTALPYLQAAYRAPDTLSALDNDFDASTICSVARRASIAQGKALITVWERSLVVYTRPTESSACDDAPITARASHALAKFMAQVKQNQADIFGLRSTAHFAPLFGVVCAALSVTCSEASFLFLLNHAKAVLSAAVRAGVMGPYQSQAILANPDLRLHIERGIAMYADVDTTLAAVTAPAMDLWMGRHELLYSRIFNS